MVEFLGTFAVQEILKKTLKIAAEQISLAWGFKKELSKLRNSLLMVEAILRDVDRIKAQHHSVRLWVEKLEDIVFESNILLDELVYEDLRRKVETGKGKIVSDFISPSKNHFIFRVKMANRIMDIAKELHDHYGTASAVGLVAVSSKETDFDLSQIQETDSFIDEFGVIGREIEVSEIVNQVINCSNQKDFSVIPIVGMGGLGKTALVKVVFNHETIKGHFDRTIWVCVSEPFVVKKILRAVLETLDANFGGLDSKEALLKELQTLLSDKNYFLVLDDVWNEDLNLWNELKACLLKITRKSGSVIVVTTRSDGVAEIMETLSRHHLRKLSNENCWSLFKQCAFANELQIIPELDVVREQLVQKFGGIPLIVKVLGGTVRFDKNHERLQSTLESLIRIPHQDGNHVLSTIKLSVDRLPSSSLKQCFAYCSNFPEDFEFKKEALIQMWIAQGFIELSKGSSATIEDIGDKYFNILLSRSLFQDVVKDKRGRIISCKMHDLIHDVACAISNAKKFQLRTFHYIENDEYNEYDESGEYIENDARKLHMFFSHRHAFHFHNEIRSFAYLRVLITHSWLICNLPDSIVELKHLRYLDISYSSIGELPKSIVMLFNLQTLRLGSLIKDLPKNLRKLVNLRHLEFSIDPQKMPQQLGQLTQLQTLSSFVAGSEKGCTIEELGLLKNLRGKLRLLCLERVKSKEEAMAAHLKGKDGIFHLNFQWSCRGGREGSNYNDLNVLEALQPHKNLQVLKILNFAGELFPNGTFVEKLSEIYLHDCRRCETLPMLGQLSKLEVLEIRCLDSVKSIGNEFYGIGNYNQKALFPRLKSFHIFEMNSLEHWEELAVVSKVTIFPHLESFCIAACPKLKKIPNLFASYSGRFEIDSVDSKLFPSFQGLINLRSAKILGCENLGELPKGLEFCASLEKLWISNCPNLNSTPNLQNMQKLSCLNIRDLQKLPEGFSSLTNLKDLSIHGPLQYYDWNPLIHLNSLENLVLVDLGSGITQLPQQIEHLIALRSLHISLFDCLEALPEWLGNLTSLEALKLYNCRNLKQWPSKEAMLKLTKLISLRICGCPVSTKFHLGRRSVLVDQSIAQVG